MEGGSWTNQPYPEGVLPIFHHLPARVAPPVAPRYPVLGAPTSLRVTHCHHRASNVSRGHTRPPQIAQFETYTLSIQSGRGDRGRVLAPYRVHRIITDYDATGWRPTKGELDRYGREIPDTEYHIRDFERVVALQARTEAIAGHLTNFLKQTDRFAKTTGCDR